MNSKMPVKIKAVTGSRTSKGSIFRKCQQKLKQFQDRERAKAPYSENAIENELKNVIENEPDSTILAKI